MYECVCERVRVCVKLWQCVFRFENGDIRFDSLKTKYMYVSNILFCDRCSNRPANVVIA